MLPFLETLLLLQLLLLLPPPVRLLQFLATAAAVAAEDDGEDSDEHANIGGNESGVRFVLGQRWRGWQYWPSWKPPGTLGGGSTG